MTRLLARIWCAVLLLPMLGVLAPTTPAQAADPVSDGARYLASCLPTARTLSVMFLIDRSGSLATTNEHSGTDDDGLRYEAVATALDTLAGMRAPDGRPFAVEASMATFSHDYSSIDSVVDWTLINKPDNGATLSNMVKRLKEKSTPGGGTDFRKALQGAHNDFSDRLTDDSCRVLLWFTDGEFAAGGIDTNEALTDMCRPGDGIIDTFRRDGITVVGLQLSNGGHLKRLVLGGQGSSSCGTQPLPGGSAPGIYLQADDAASLRGLFVLASSIIDGCTPTPESSSTIDPGIRRLRVVITSPKPATSITLTTPQGKNLEVPATGDHRLDPFRIATRQPAPDVTIAEVQLPPGGAPGRWQATSDVGVANREPQYCIFSDLHLALAPNQQPPAGETSTVDVHILDADNQPVTMSDFTGVQARAATVRNGKTSAAKTGPIDGHTIPVTVEPTATEPRLPLNVALDYTTASGIRMPALTLKSAVSVAMPSEYPTVPTDALHLGTALRTETTSGTLPVNGSRLGPTKVCFGAAADVRVPEEAAGTVPSIPGLDADGCLALQPNESRELQITVTPAAEAIGDGAATIPVTLHPAPSANASTQPATMELPVTWRLDKPLSLVSFGGWSLLFLIVAILTPFVALALASYLSARFDTRGLHWQQVPVRLNGATITPQDPDRRTLVGTDTRPVSGNPRKLTIPSGAGGLTLWAKARLVRFTEPPRFFATTASNSRVVSTAGRGDGELRTAPVTPGLGMVGFMIVSDADLLASRGENVPATLVIVSRGAAGHKDEEVLRQQLANARSRFVDAAGPFPDAAPDAGPRLGGGPLGGSPRQPTARLRGNSPLSSSTDHKNPPRRLGRN